MFKISLRLLMLVAFVADCIAFPFPFFSNSQFFGQSPTVDISI